jgi:hypothetical protein
MQRTDPRRRLRQVAPAVLLIALAVLTGCNRGGDSNGGADGGTRAPTSTSSQ